jgi:hypothetical protein
MSKDQPIRIELTPEQTQRIKEASGHEISAMELKVEELEQRIVPSLFQACATGSHFPEVKV